MIINLNIYEVYIPANATIFLASFTKVIDFDWLNPFRYYQWFIDPKFRVSDWLAGEERLPFDNEDQTYSIVD